MHRPMITALAALALAAGCSGNRNLGPTTSSGTGTETGTGTGSTTVSLGSGTAANFQSGVIAILTNPVSTGGTTSLQVTLVDQATAALYTTATAVTFTSPCQVEGKASIVATGTTPASNTVTTSSGTATANYTDTDCNTSTDKITATAIVKGQTLTAVGTVTIAQAAVAGAIKFISATPSRMSMKGAGSAAGSATSSVIFKVLDSSGVPRAGAAVTFALTSTAGGISISPASAVSDANGQVQTVVSGGTVATKLTVSASTMGGKGSMIGTESDSLTVECSWPYGGSCGSL